MMLLQPGNVLSTNLFAYCNNNPVMYSDPTGHIAIVDDAVIGGVLLTILVVGVVSAYISTPQFQSSWRSFCSSVGSAISSAWNWLKSLFVSEADRITKAITNSVAKAGTIIRAARNVEYFAAVEVKFGKAKKQSSFIPVAPISYSQAIALVKAGGNVFAISKQKAYNCAKAAGNGREPTKPEKHGSLGFFWHYHTGSRAGGHVFYL